MENNNPASHVMPFIVKYKSITDVEYSFNEYQNYFDCVFSLKEQRDQIESVFLLHFDSYIFVDQQLTLILGFLQGDLYENYDMSFRNDEDTPTIPVYYIEEYFSYESAYKRAIELKKDDELATDQSSLLTRLTD